MKTLLTFLAAATLGSQAFAQPVTIEELKVLPKTSSLKSDAGKHYVKVEYQATVNEAIAPKMTLIVKGKAWVGERILVDDFRSLSKLDELQAGQSKGGSAVLFMQSGLGGSADRLELTFTLIKSLEKTGQTVGTYCFKAGSLTSGTCSE